MEQKKIRSAAFSYRLGMKRRMCLARSEFADGPKQGEKAKTSEDKTKVQKDLNIAFSGKKKRQGSVFR